MVGFLGFPKSSCCELLLKSSLLIVVHMDLLTEDKKAKYFLSQIDQVDPCAASGCEPILVEVVVGDLISGLGAPLTRDGRGHGNLGVGGIS